MRYERRRLLLIVGDIERKKKNGVLSELKRNKVLFAMLIPALLFFLINNYSPMIGIYYAFTKFNFVGGLFGSQFVGLENFKFLFKSGKLLSLTLNTVGYNVVFIIVTNVIQIFCAILLSRLSSRIFKRVSQSVIFLPYFVSYVILNVIVYNIFNYDIGFLNSTRVGFGLEPYDAYSDPKVWPTLMVILYLWKQLGYGMVIYLATITGISQELYEAAEIDGANMLQQTIYITIPQLFPTFVILLLFSLGGIMRGQFDLFYQVIGNNGLLFDVTDILDTFVYRTLKHSYDIGMGTAAGVYQSIFGFAFITLVNGLIKRKHPEYALF
jgi:putative aldouronate transport system permease protein